MFAHPAHPALRRSLVPVVITALLLSALASLALPRVVSAQTDLFAELSGANEVPGPGDPDGAGYTNVFVDPGAGEVCVFTEVFDIAAATAAHIHEGAAGVAGPPVVTLPTPDAGGYADDCVAGLDPTLLADIEANPTDYYVNVHTSEYPDGAVRGQLQVPPAFFHASLSGDAEVPGPGDPDGSGFADLTIDVAGGEVCGFLIVHDIAAATAAHIHEGAAGVAGSPVVTLLTPNAGGEAEGCVDGLDPTLLQAIVDNPTGYYVNVHTGDFPDGAVRGQLGEPPTTLFAGLEGSAEVPGPGDPDGGGFASIDIYLDLGQVCAFIDTADIAAATAAHVHAGAAGVAGPPVITLPTPGPDGVGEGCVTGLDPALLGDILADPSLYYVNVHTGEYPDGAIRGQLSFDFPPPPECGAGLLCNGLIGPGTYTYTGFGTDLTFTTANDWYFFEDDIPSASLFDVDESAGLYLFPFVGDVYADPCDEGSVTTIGDSPAEVMAWLADRGFLELSSATSVTYGGASGLQVDLVSATTPSECTDFPFALVFDYPDDIGFFFLETGSTGRIIALDVAGETILVIAEYVDYGDGDPATFLAQAQGVVDSFVWALGGAPTAPPTSPPQLPNTAVPSSRPASAGGPMATLAIGLLVASSVAGLAFRARPMRR